MATTTNYGWPTPDDTDLVKDGADAIRTLGSSIDSTTEDLNPATTEGDMQYASATAHVNERLAIGTAGQVLAVNSGADAPEWVTPAAGGGMTLIASLTASAATAISFTSIPATFKHLLITATGIQDVTNEGWGVRFNNNSSNDYSQTGIFFQDPLSPAIQQTDNANTNGFGLSGSQRRGVILSHQAAGRGHISSEFWVFDYTDATNEKVVRWNARGSRLENGGAHPAYCHHQATYEELAAINRVDFIRSSTQTFTGMVRLYGVS